VVLDAAERKSIFPRPKLFVSSRTLAPCGADYLRPDPEQSALNARSWHN